MKQLEQEIWDEVEGEAGRLSRRLYEYFSRDLFRYGYRICRIRGWFRTQCRNYFQLWKKRLQLIQVESPRFYLYRSLRNRLIPLQRESNRFVCFARSYSGYLVRGTRGCGIGWIESTSQSVEQLMLHLTGCRSGSGKPSNCVTITIFTTEEISAYHGDERAIRS